MFRVRPIWTKKGRRSAERDWCPREGRLSVRVRGREGIWEWRQIGTEKMRQKSTSHVTTEILDHRCRTAHAHSSMIYLSTKYNYWKKENRFLKSFLINIVKLSLTSYWSNSISLLDFERYLKFEYSIYARVKFKRIREKKNINVLGDGKSVKFKEVDEKTKV